MEPQSCAELEHTVKNYTKCATKGTKQKSDEFIYGEPSQPDLASPAQPGHLILASIASPARQGSQASTAQPTPHSPHP